MFCDLVGSTPLSQQLDPEELREVLRAYQETCAGVICRFDGYIANYLGDGLLIYFGYPLAHEDDAQRAVRAGLGIIEAMQRLNLQLQEAKGVTLHVRLGIHTGLVVAGEMGSGDRRDPMAIVGETPNIAARLQEVATPDTVVISAATHRLVQGFFSCQALGAHSLKGLSQPVVVYQVLQERPVQNRLEAAISTGLTPLVGRTEEVRLLLERWEEVKKGVGQVVLLQGEAGIGKSRLVQVIKDRIATEPHLRLECRCSPYYQNSALYPVIDLLQRALQLSRDESTTSKIAKLERFLDSYALPLPQTLPLFASLLSLPLGQDYKPLSLTPQRQKQQTLQILLHILQKIASQQLVLLVIEDLHWIDPSTLEFLTLLITQDPPPPILTLLTYRPGFQPTWPGSVHLTQMTLTRLTPSQVEEMITELGRGKAFPDEVLGQLVEKTDGIPLFVEELTKMVLESDLLVEEEDRYTLLAPLPPLAIPSTLHDSLMARLDRLAMVKEVAQVGATLGRSFPYELLQAILPLDETTLQQALTRLVDAELLYQQGSPPYATYRFKHALIQETAYHSLLKSTRQRYHQRIAQVLEERFPETREIHPELLAHHYTEAGIWDKALACWQSAGQRAIERSAHLEAIGHLRKGLEILSRLPDTAERTLQELSLHIALGIPLIATRGYAAPEVEQVYARAHELCRQLKEVPHLFPALRGLWGFYNVRAELRIARELGEQLLVLAQQTQDPTLLLDAHRILGNTLFWCGDLPTARTHLEQGLKLYDPQQHRVHAFRTGLDPGVACLGFAAVTLWLLGYPDQALEKSQKALTLAQTLSHPFTLAYALNLAAILSQLRGEREKMQEQAESMISLSREQGFPFWEAVGMIYLGWTLAEQGKGEEGLAHMQQGLAAYRSLGATLGLPSFLALLAEVYGEGGETAQGMYLLEEALERVDKHAERWWEAELYR
ncbi:MAG: hypothetical protein D6736_20715, partial [Nitrospinota bacterium]